ncbi:GlxA family transcriptional regulator [Pseudomonas jinjuensis]|uniref:Transcriptional regulator GlxA family, contains an amidase domain and an AraC-type DNA-binding HTH domain n=1 Tax=Pseudomonas jinjuensis TaxID=198616 RepID=A0A1H0ENK8_9PSED|nr:GlxA family transcriptional regulator [Pseudomonas jinjuensis]SDN83930.1 Transcriptional regulator GlxA family, contains an amidase domain and an AraC-type DNA-binding HTH domain [Pseudomonas jinjuensis]
MGARNDTLEIGLLLYPGAQLAAVHGLTDLFGVANRMAAEHSDTPLPVLRVRHWAADAQSGEIRCVFDSHPQSAGRMSVVILPPSLDALPEAGALQPFSQWLRRQHAAGATLGSVCAGAFVLAQTGLLDGRRATTHWGSARALAERFPAVEVDADQLIVDDGDIITAGGLMAWTDLGLALVGRLLSPSIASATAHFLVVDLSRQSQRYFSRFAPPLTHGDAAVLKVQHWLQKQGGREVSLGAMAAQAGLGERTFLRRFQQATGLKPTEYCQQLRVARGRELLEFTQRSVDQIAWEVGYQDPGAFRKVFQRIVGLAPKEYRMRFGVRRAGREESTGT